MADSAESVRNILENLYSIGQERDWDAREIYLSDDLVIYEADPLPYAGEFRGKSALRDLFTIVAAHWASFDIEFHAVTAGEGYGVGVLTLTLTSKITGKTIKMPVTEQFRVENGLVVEIRPFYFDPAAVAALDVPDPS